jgi:hypothetical protein
LLPALSGVLFGGDKSQNGGVSVKKMFFLPLCAAVVCLAAGCTSVGSKAEWKETRALRESYEVVSSRTNGECSSHEIWIIFFPICAWGDNSFETAKINALRRAPGSDDLINISADFATFYAFFYRKNYVSITGAAIRYTSGGKSEPVSAGRGAR